MHPKWTLSGYWQIWAQHTRQDSPKHSGKEHVCPDCGEVLQHVKSSGNASLVSCPKGHGYWLTW